MLFIVGKGKEREEKFIDQRLVNSNVVVPSSSEKQREWLDPVSDIDSLEFDLDGDLFLP